jgi:hypothetical protein
MKGARLKEQGKISITLNTVHPTVVLNDFFNRLALSLKPFLNSDQE